MKKYKLTKEVKEVYGIKLYRIEALIDFSILKKGEKGGWIEKEENLSQEGNACVSDNACVFGNACVSDNACVYGDARVYDNAFIFDNARIFGDACVSGNACIFGNACVYGDARVYGDACVSGNVCVYGKLKLKGGYFYHTKSKSEIIEKVKIEDEEILCSNPKFGEEEKPPKKTIKIKKKWN